MNAAVIKRMCIASVSYTHLDVYKRQLNDSIQHIKMNPRKKVEETRYKGNTLKVKKEENEKETNLR